MLADRHHRVMDDQVDRAVGSRGGRRARQRPGRALPHGLGECEQMAEAVPARDRPADLGHIEVKRLEGGPGGGGERLVEGRRGQDRVMTLCPQPPGERGERPHVTLRADGKQQHSH